MDPLTNESERAAFEKPTPDEVRCFLENGGALIGAPVSEAVERWLTQYADLLAEQAKAEPVGWLTSTGDGDVVFSWDRPHPADDPNPDPVYLHPAPSTDRVAAQGGDGHE